LVGERLGVGGGVASGGERAGLLQEVVKGAVPAVERELDPSVDRGVRDDDERAGPRDDARVAVGGAEELRKHGLQRRRCVWVRVGACGCVWVRVCVR